MSDKTEGIVQDKSDSFNDAVDMSRYPQETVLDVILANLDKKFKEKDGNFKFKLKEILNLINGYKNEFKEGSDIGRILRTNIMTKGGQDLFADFLDAEAELDKDARMLINKKSMEAVSVFDGIIGWGEWFLRENREKQKTQKIKNERTGNPIPSLSMAEINIARLTKNLKTWKSNMLDEDFSSGLTAQIYGGASSFFQDHVLHQTGSDRETTVRWGDFANDIYKSLSEPGSNGSNFKIQTMKESVLNHVLNDITVNGDPSFLGNMVIDENNFKDYLKGMPQEVVGGLVKEGVINNLLDLLVVYSIKEKCAEMKSAVKLYEQNLDELGPALEELEKGEVKEYVKQPFQSGLVTALTKSVRKSGEELLKKVEDDMMHISTDKKEDLYLQTKREVLSEEKEEKQIITLPSVDDIVDYMTQAEGDQTLIGFRMVDDIEANPGERDRILVLYEQAEKEVKERLAEKERSITKTKKSVASATDSVEPVLHDLVVEPLPEPEVKESAIEVVPEEDSDLEKAIQDPAGRKIETIAENYNTLEVILGNRGKKHENRIRAGDVNKLVDVVGKAVYKKMGDADNKRINHIRKLLKYSLVKRDDVHDYRNTKYLNVMKAVSEIGEKGILVDELQELIEKKTGQRVSKPTVRNTMTYLSNDLGVIRKEREGRKVRYRVSKSIDEATPSEITSMQDTVQNIRENLAEQYWQ